MSETIYARRPFERDEVLLGTHMSYKGVEVRVYGYKDPETNEQVVTRIEDDQVNEPTNEDGHV